MVEMSGAASAAPVTGIRSRDAESVGRKADTVTQTQGRVFVLGKGFCALVQRSDGYAYLAAQRLHSDHPHSQPTSNGVASSRP
jgi:hypothetical protein